MSIVLKNQKYKKQTQDEQNTKVSHKDSTCSCVRTTLPPLLHPGPGPVQPPALGEGMSFHEFERKKILAGSSFKALSAI